MAATKISDLPAATALASGDLIPVVLDPAGSPSTRKITVANFYSNVIVTAKFSNTLTFTANVTSSLNMTANNLYITYTGTPATANDAVIKGKVWYDTSYLYVAVANNTIKRVSLSSF